MRLVMVSAGNKRVCRSGPGIAAVMICVYHAFAPIIAPAAESSVIDRLKSLKIAEQVEFEEQVHNAFFMQPQISRGQLLFDKTTKVLVKSIYEPDSIILTASADQVTIDEAGAQKTIDISANPVFVSLIETFRALLSADFDSLLTLFSIELEISSESRWSMVLVPKNEQLRGHIESITVAAESDEIDSVKTVFTNGDWQMLDILPDAPDQSSSDSGEGG